MNRRRFLGSLAGAAAAAGAGRKLNFVFVLIDDMGWRDLGCYGSQFYQTPNIDRLAAQGMRFTNAYAACPVCSPSRASIMTGKYPARLRLTDWIPGRKQWPASKLLTPSFNQQLPLAETTIAEALKPAGYTSASIGKWHLGGEGFYPENQGFDLNVGGNHKGSTSSYFGPFPMPGLQGATKDDYLTERLSDAAEKFIEQNRNNPFFLYLPEYAVHLPLQARESAVAKYRARIRPGDPQNDPTYAAMVESVDIAVGRLTKQLEDLGIADRTVIVFTADNGGVIYEGRSKKPVTSNAPLRAGKGHLYEGGIREPLIVRWPGVTKPGSVCETPVSGVDYFPTILDMAGRKSPAVDGVSIAPLLRGGSLKREAIYWHYPHYSNQGGPPGGAVRAGDYKLIEFYEDGRAELFNLRADIGERRNLALAEPKRAARLRKMLKKWRASVRAAMPSPNPKYDPQQADQGLTGIEPSTPPVSHSRTDR